jgi:hypothetical protein
MRLSKNPSATVPSNGVAELRKQVVGAYGEKAVEAELLRKGWVTANINTSIKNAADFDIFAHKGRHKVNVRVKTCKPEGIGFTFGFRPKEKIKTNGLAADDFTILVRMGSSRREDVFYVIPTRVVRRCLNKHREFYLKQPNRDGTEKVDTGQWYLRFGKGSAPNSNIEGRWKRYLENWAMLEGYLSKQGRRGLQHR